MITSELHLHLIETPVSRSKCYMYYSTAEWVGWYLLFFFFGPLATIFYLLDYVTLGRISKCGDLEKIDLEPKLCKIIEFLQVSFTGILHTLEPWSKTFNYFTMITILMDFT